MSDDFTRRWALAALAVGLLLRAAYAWRASSARYLPTSSDGYETIALSIVERGEYALAPGRPTMLREPSFPLYLAAVYAVCGRRPGVVIALNILLSCATGILLWGAARRLFGERTALASFWIFMLHPQSIYYCGYFFRETWLCLWAAVLIVSSLDWSAREDDPAGARSALIGGTAAALFGLANSAVLPGCALAGLALWFAAPRRARLRRAALYFAPLTLALALWTARGYAVTGRLVAGSTHGGEEFLQALVVPPEDLGTERQTRIVAETPIFAETAMLPEAERNERLMRAAFAWIGAHPALYASRAAAGLIKFWRPWPYPRVYQHSYALLVALSLLSDGWIIPLGFFGLWRLRARWREAPAFPALVFGLTLVYGLIHAVIRYRMPLMGGMIVAACGAMS